MTWKRTLIPIPILVFTSTHALASDALAGPPPDDEARPELLELRAEMADRGEDEALRAKPHFRPLCDAQGYPLVGNLLPKEPDETMPSIMLPLEPPYQPSEFCTLIRADESQT